MNALFTEKDNKQQLQNDLSAESRLNWLWTLSDTQHNRLTDFLQMARLHAQGGGGDQKPPTPTKAFFLFHPRPRHAAGGTPQSLGWN